MPGPALLPLLAAGLGTGVGTTLAGSVTNVLGNLLGGGPAPSVMDADRFLQREAVKEAQIRVSKRNEPLRRAGRRIGLGGKIKQIGDLAEEAKRLGLTRQDLEGKSFQEQARIIRNKRQQLSNQNTDTMNGTDINTSVSNFLDRVVFGNDEERVQTGIFGPKEPEPTAFDKIIDWVKANVLLVIGLVVVLFVGIPGVFEPLIKKKKVASKSKSKKSKTTHAKPQTSTRAAAGAAKGGKWTKLSNGNWRYNVTGAEVTPGRKKAMQRMWAQNKKKKK